ncbi:hypothetical protein EIN_134390 [Entamoeba invadens IP1]|uniref:Uncharacterized protein n=1 Tax=Entamoeba invadens IP1 TaxID=370355 RepID=A0A0A1TX63_ENTIV|nr:hypothetical protein EIN_134390 [Entamoeba invadens IP1]ELP85895.1 hypothetical protein EIN_134390 [Entamoeba invadens IP1]|eukprot:XP_004185241.1 hypothetical protein EIN_134390 [Entamoeba invadens IP1]
MPCQLNNFEAFFQSKIDYKNFETYQQSVLIAILSKFATITIKKPRKATKVTEVHPLIQTIDFGDDMVNVASLACSKCQLNYKKDCNKMKYHAAFCRFEKNKKNFVQNLLIDMLLEFGFFFESKMAKKSTKTIQLERIASVFYKGRLTLDFQEFVLCGKEVTDYIGKEFQRNQSTIVIKNDPIISSLLDKYIL